MAIKASPRRCETLVLLAALVLLAEGRLLAYIDPGSGALMWQALVAGLVGAAYYFRRFFEGLLSKGRRSRPPADPE